MCKVNTNEKISHIIYQHYKPPCSNVKPLMQKYYRHTLKSLISSCCFNFSKKDWKKSVLSTCRGATHKASISAPGRNMIWHQYLSAKYSKQRCYSRQFMSSDKNHYSSSNAFCGTHSIKNWDPLETNKHQISVDKFNFSLVYKHYAKPFRKMQTSHSL